MRTHTYWKTYEEYLKWSFNPPKQINVKGVVVVVFTINISISVASSYYYDKLVLVS